MAALLDLHPDTADAVASGVADLHAMIDHLHTIPVGSSRPSADVAEVDRAIRRLESYKLQLVAAADWAGVAKDAGFTGADAWLAKTTATSRADAARQVALAGELEAGHDATAEALDAGLVSPEHAVVIVRATGQLPENVSAEQRQVVETELVEKASRFSPDQLRRIARRAVEAVEPDQTVVDAHENELVRTEEEAARDRCSLRLHDNGDGTTTGHFTIPALAAGTLGKVIDAMTAPRRMREPAGPDYSERSFDWRHRRGLAFAELLEHLPTDHLHPKASGGAGDGAEPSQMSRRSAAGMLGLGRLGDPTHPPEPAPRDLNPAPPPAANLDVVSRPSLTLAPQPPEKASGQRLEHDTCVATGCERPYAWCELHHRQPWAEGGRTDLANAVPLCHRHHQWIHDTGFNHQTMPDGSVRFSRRT